MSSGSQQSARLAAEESMKPVQDTLIRAVSSGSNPGTWDAPALGYLTARYAAGS
jgi:hypothetical protein